MVDGDHVLAPSPPGKFDVDSADEIIELGGLRVPSVMTVNLDSFQVMPRRWVAKVPRDITLLRLSLEEALAVEDRFFLRSGTPSHLELTLGTCGGNFWLA